MSGYSDDSDLEEAYGSDGEEQFVVWTHWQLGAGGTWTMVPFAAPVLQSIVPHGTVIDLTGDSDEE